VASPAPAPWLLRLATSGTYRQNFKSGGRQFSHLIDPRTGRPITHTTVSVSVLHPDCAHADAWATAMNVIGHESGLPLADQLGLAVQFVTEQADGKLEVTSSKSWPGDESKSPPPSNPARKGYR
jgi:thiamine biosynthesis lipoprotein